MFSISSNQFGVVMLTMVVCNLCNFQNRRQNQRMLRFIDCVFSLRQADDSNEREIQITFFSDDSNTSLESM